MDRGRAGHRAQWDGRALTTLGTGTTKDLTAITGTSPNDVWAGGSAGTLLHFDGATWSVSATPAGQTINDLWADHDGDLFIADSTGAVTVLVYELPQ